MFHGSEKRTHGRNNELTGLRHENMGDQKFCGCERFIKWLEELGKASCRLEKNEK
jgi:hypothetical protein